LGRGSRNRSRSGSGDRGFGSSRFGGDHSFDRGGNSFGRDSSFGGDDSWLLPDLFGLALNLGGLGLRGFSLLGPGLGGLGIQGLGLLSSALTAVPQDAGLESRDWGPGPILYPNGNCACQQ
jgi:hypothetical protein